LPSEKILSQKQQYVAELAEQLKNSCAGVIIDYKGITVAEDTEFRKELREAGVQYSVVKNTMLRFAAKEAGLDGICDVLDGTTALATSAEDPIAAAKVISKYADKLKDKVTIKIGFMDGEVMEAAKVVELGKLPSKEQLVGQLLSVLVAPIRGLAVALNAIAEKENA
jgi:large subunit ribosomal protein L10